MRRAADQRIELVVFFLYRDHGLSITDLTKVFWTDNDEIWKLIEKGRKRDASAVRKLLAAIDKVPR